MRPRATAASSVSTRSSQWPAAAAAMRRSGSVTSVSASAAAIAGTKSEASGASYSRSPKRASSGSGRVTTGLPSEKYS